MVVHNQDVFVNGVRSKTIKRSNDSVKGDQIELQKVVFHFELCVKHLHQIKNGRSYVDIGLLEEDQFDEEFNINLEQLEDFDSLKKFCVQPMLEYMNNVFNNSDYLVYQIAEAAFKLNQHLQREASEIQRIVELEVRNTHIYENVQEYCSLSGLDEFQGDFTADAETILGLVQTASMEEDMQKLQKGASRASINALERTWYRKEEWKEDADRITSCSVCTEDFLTDEEISRMPCSSSHIFHTCCIGKWLEVSNICPLCRYQMPTDDQLTS
ncbi:hypothetical protein FRX31_028159 [Thalictrum thalictroides]|uniref:RING-type domain-containing protein n=1 Tax=Thalictrum thalictroides TaxID=46969 RepID=A0A7J6VAY7_THATH|nr:hypothetical protein FRX31_028159 [Thalictrum thalictroides]